MGDVNYRVKLPAKQALTLMEKGEWGALRAADELSRSMSAGAVFAGFREAPITFLPTYRRVVGEAGRFHDHELRAVSSGGGVERSVLERGYTVAVKKDAGERTPSYTDRVLFGSLADLSSRLTYAATADGLLPTALPATTATSGRHRS
jgi:hypothetical protein